MSGWTNVSSYFTTTVGTIDARSNGSMVYLRIVGIEGESLYENFSVDILNSSVFPLDPYFTPCIWSGVVRSFETDPAMYSIYTAMGTSGNGWGSIDFFVQFADYLDPSISDYSLGLMYPIAS